MINTAHSTEPETPSNWRNPARSLSPSHFLFPDWRKTDGSGAGEMAQRLRALTALPEVLSSIPSNHMVAHNHLE
ncbi:Lipogenin [Cricetulus griseus]|uniref:Lipogenin n=1 Tax=Cricetulus griseus TaxID=10029 RepID=A0A061I861_CRIGR|nr:Lipogenin [Cricetulus griseus]